MRRSEIIVVTLSLIAILAFVIFLWDYYMRSAEVQVIKRDMYFDSLILKQQEDLRRADSLLEHRINTENLEFKHRLQYQERQIKKIQRELEK